MKLHVETKPSPFSLKVDFTPITPTAPVTTTQGEVAAYVPATHHVAFEGTFEGLCIDLELSLEEMPIMASHLKEMEEQARKLVESLLPLLSRTIIETMEAVERRDRRREEQNEAQ